MAVQVQDKHRIEKVQLSQVQINMAFDTSWDVDKYKQPYEIEKHWELKKKFILTHKELIPETELICLAQTFLNIEILGCRYEDEIMKRIEHLGKGLTEDKHLKEKAEFQRSFVPASSAAAERAKARYEGPSTDKKPEASSPKNIAFVKSADLSTCSTKDEVGSSVGYISVAMDDSPERSGEKRPQPPPSGYETGGQKYMKMDSGARSLPLNVLEVMNSGPFGKVVLFQSTDVNESPVSIIERTASAAHMTTGYSFTDNDGMVSCRLQLDGIFLASGNGNTAKAAKESACRVAIERLKETSFTIQVKMAYSGSEKVDRDMNPTAEGQRQAAHVDVPLENDNIGRKLMKLMGWAGGGLGKNEQGIEEPVKPNDSSVSRSGLGIANMGDFRAKATRILENFAYSDTKDDLIFSPDFTKEERKILHGLVRKFNLKSRSYGKTEEARHLVVFKRISPWEIVSDLIQCGGITEKYFLIPPTSM